MSDTSSPFGTWLDAFLSDRTRMVIPPRAADVARRLGVSEMTMSRWRGGAIPAADKLPALFDALGLTPAEIGEAWAALRASGAKDSADNLNS